MNHPLKVYHPGKGIHYLARWWTHNKQHQVVVARSEKALNDVVNSIFTMYEDARVDAAYEVELVGPSLYMCKVATKAAYDESVENFLNEVTYGVRHVVAAGKSLPGQFMKCKGYSCKYIEEGEEEGSPDSWRNDTHHDCRHCINGYTLFGFSPDSFYQIYHKKWYLLHPKKVYSDTKYVALYSTAEPASDDEKIWAATPDFGHHQRGVELDVVDMTYSSSYTGVLFYFRKRREMDVTAWNELQEKFKALRVKDSEDRKAASKIRKAQEENEAAEKCLAALKLL